MTDKKNILIYIPVFPKRSETFIEREVSLLLEGGKANYTVIALEKGNGDLSANLNGVVRYVRPGFFDFVLGVVWGAAQAPRLIKNLKYILKTKDRSLTKHLYISLKALIYGYKLKRYKPDHIHSHFLSEPSTLMLYVSIILNIPFSISAHARDVFGFDSDKDMAPDMTLTKLKSAKFIRVCNTKAYNHIKEQAEESNVPYDNLYLQYHGLDFAKLNVTRSNEQPEMNNPYFKILSVGRLEEKKGFTYLIEASNLLKNKGINHKIKIVGWGKQYELLLQQIEQNGVKDFVEIFGENKGLPFEEVKKLLVETDLFVLPSIETEDGDAEGIPNTILEASYFKKPVISTLSGSISEFIVSHKNGILVPQKDSHSLADAIELLYFDTQKRKLLAEAAHEDVIKKFNMAENVHAFESLFQL